MAENLFPDAEPERHRPRPPVESPVEQWAELPADRTQPTLDDASRFLVERHFHALEHGELDEVQTVPVTAVYVGDGLSGVRIEFGPWALDPDSARLLAVSLNALADAADAAMR